MIPISLACVTPSSISLQVTLGIPPTQDSYSVDKFWQQKEMPGRKAKYLRLPMSAKLLPFQELLLAALFSAAIQFLHFCHFDSFYMCLPILKRRKNPTKRRKNPTKRRKKNKGPKWSKCANWNGKKNWKRRKFKQSAIIIAVSEFER